MTGCFGGLFLFCMTFDLVSTMKMSIHLRVLQWIGTVAQAVGLYVHVFFPTPFYQNLFATHSSSIVRKCRPLIPSEEIWSLAKTAFFGEFSPVLVVSACTSAWFHVHFYLCNNTFPHFKLLFRLSYMRWHIMTVIAVVSCCLYLTLYIQYSGKTYSFIAERNHRRYRWVS